MPSLFESESSSSHKAPSEFYCPLTLEIMREPMLSCWGVSYERENIFTWLKLYGNTCPLTGKPLTLNDLVSNQALQARIEAWCSVHHLDKARKNGDSSDRHDNQKEENIDCLA